MVKVMDLGLAPYGEVWKLQHQLVERRKKDLIDDTLIIVEHPHVITTGKHGDRKNLKLTPDEYRKRGIEFFTVDRGGDVTYHGPGQIVGYLIFKLKDHTGSLRKFIYLVENAIIEVLRDYGIESERDEKFIGVWVGKRKIAAVGMALTESVVYHGFALNVNTDMSYFDLIVACGLEDRGTVSMKQLLGYEVNLEDVKEKLVKVIVDRWEKSRIKASETAFK